MTSQTKNTSFLTKGPVVCLFAGISCLLWGSAFPCIKIGYRMLSIAADETARQLLFAGVRFTLAGLLVLLFALLQRLLTGKSSTEIYDTSVAALLPTKRSFWKKIVLLSLFQTIGQYFLFYIGMANTSGVKASIIEGTNVFVAILVASMVFHLEKLTPAKLIGCTLGFLGVIIINITGTGLDLNMKVTGEGFIFLSTFAYALSSVIMKHYSKEEDPVLLSGWQFVIGGCVLTLVALLMGGRISIHTPAQLLLLLYMAFISAGAYTLWGLLIKFNPVSRVTIYGFMNPVFGVILSFLLLHESSQDLGIRSILALILVCIGIFIVNKKQEQ